MGITLRVYSYIHPSNCAIAIVTIGNEDASEQKEINDFYDNKNFDVNNSQKKKKISKEMPAGKLINNLVNVSDFNYSLCKR